MNPVNTSGMVEAELSNGVRVLLQADMTAPIVSFWTWYRVGSRDELPEKTGVSHWVEHMQFKGTSRLAKGKMFADVSRVGGSLNALTSHDWTAYYETLPADHIDLALSIEAERMRNSVFDPEEVESERTVILSERQGAENNPGYVLYEEVTGAAFRAHPYRHMVIGHEADLRRITRNDLYEHYRRFYHPGNAFVVAVGAFDADDLLHRMEQSFGEIPAGEEIPGELGIAEPSQPGERRVHLRRASGTPYLRMAFHAPAATDADCVPLLVTEAILSGGKPMGFGGGGAMGRSSRLYRTLVAAGLARSAQSDMSITIDPYLFQISVTALPKAKLATIEDVIDQELLRLRTETVSTEELRRATRQLEAQLIYSTEGVTNQAYWRGLWGTVDGWQRASSLLSEIQSVSVDDVQRVSQRYFGPDRRTVGWLEPDSREIGNIPPVKETLKPFVGIAAWGLGGPLESTVACSEPFREATLNNGVRVLGQDRPDSESIALRVRIPAGTVRERETESGLAHLTARSMLRGSADRSFEEISTQTDELGAEISIDSGREFIEARVRCLHGDVAEMTHLLAQTLRLPDFPSDEVERVKAEQLGAIAAADNDTRATADRLMRRGVYPEPRPFGRRVLGDADIVSGLDHNDVTAFHAREIIPAIATIAIVGNLGVFERAVDLLGEAFAAWSGRAANLPTADRNLPNNANATIRLSEDIQDKSQADIAVGLATIERGNPHYYALDIANLILGRLGLMGRLGTEVRDRQGLAYYAFSQIEPRRDGSLWVSRAGIDPTNIERALDAIDVELNRLRSELVSTDELNDAKSFSTGVLPLSLESSDGVASTLLSIEHFGLGLDFLVRYPQIIAAITRDDVREAAERHLDPRHVAIGMAKPASP